MVFAFSPVFLSLSSLVSSPVLFRRIGAKRFQIIFFFFSARYPAPIPTIDVFLVRADAHQLLPPLRLVFSVSVSVSGENVSAASLRSQKQPDHHPRDHSSHLWNDRNGVARYASDLDEEKLENYSEANYSGDGAGEGRGAARSGNERENATLGYG